MRQMRVRFSGETNIGLKRSHNEDSYFLPDADRLVIVADGMGGHASGEVASKLAVEGGVARISFPEPVRIEAGHTLEVRLR